MMMIIIIRHIVSANKLQITAYSLGSMDFGLCVKAANRTFVAYVQNSSLYKMYKKFYSNFYN